MKIQHESHGAVEDGILKSVKKHFEEFLCKEKFRITQERFAILEEIYCFPGRFDADTVYLTMKNKNYHLSRATVYNTFELLVRCNLIVKYQFNKKYAEYEQCFGKTGHSHIVCLDCDNVIAINDPEPKEFACTNSRNLAFRVHQRILNIYGKCIKHSEGECESFGKLISN